MLYLFSRPSGVWWGGGGITVFGSEDFGQTIIGPNGPDVDEVSPATDRKDCIDHTQRLCVEPRDM